jgi:hypothetical protein
MPGYTARNRGPRGDVSPLNLHPLALGKDNFGQPAEQEQTRPSGPLTGDVWLTSDQILRILNFELPGQIATQQAVVNQLRLGWGQVGDLQNAESILGSLVLRQRQLQDILAIRGVAR